VLCCCWSAKGGSGTTVVAASLALELADRGADVLLVDLAGDLPAVLAVETPGGGVGDWLSAAEELPADALRRLEVRVGPNLALLAPGALPVTGPGTVGLPPGRVELLVGLLAASDRAVVVDLGTATPDPAPLAAGLLDRADTAVLVVRACYLALRRVAVGRLRVDEVVLVEEPGRALQVRDVEEVVGAPVRVRVPVDPGVARAVDAGLLPSRRPRALRRLAALVP
jgi:Flp pilus assembly CpaE family ATPase